jgi:hypothetical protein
MEEKIKKESKFVDNVAYKSKFQFIIWINDNAICQRYFKINGFNEESVYSEEFDKCMNGIVKSIQEDLESKSRIFMWYSNLSEPFKLQGFFTKEEAEMYDIGFLSVLLDNSVSGKVVAPDGKVFEKEYVVLKPNNGTESNEYARPEEGEYVFKFSFLIDDKPVFEKIWDGNVYPKFVRNGVDLSNNYGRFGNNEYSLTSFASIVIRFMQVGKINLINDFIRRICDTLSNGINEKSEYNKQMEVYRNDNSIDSDKFRRAVRMYGVIKPVVTGHTDIKPQAKQYNYLSSFEAYKQSWKKATRKKTQDYIENLYLTNGQIDYIDRHY